MDPTKLPFKHHFTSAGHAGDTFGGPKSIVARVILNNQGGAAQTVVAYDNSAASGTKLFDVQIPAGQTVPLDFTDKGTLITTAITCVTGANCTATFIGRDY